MKKIFAVILVLTLALSLAACGGDKPAPAASAAPAPESKAAAPAPESKEEAPEADASPEYTPEQLAVAEKFGAMTDRFQALADKINADENLLAVPSLVETMNTMIDAVNEDDALFADAANLTPEVLANLEESIAAGNSFLDEMEAGIANYGGKQTVTVAVEIVNYTGADLFTLAMSPSNDESWGGNLLTEPLMAGESGVTEMTFTEDTLIWDLLAGDSQDNTLTFAGLDFSVAPLEGAQLFLTQADDGSYFASFTDPNAAPMGGVDEY